MDHSGERNLGRHTQPGEHVACQGVRHDGLDRPAVVFDWIMGFTGPWLCLLSGLPLAADWPPGRSGSPEDGVAYDEDLACRVRAVLPPAEAVIERQMFGGLAFMLGGHMFCGVVRDTLMVRLGPDAADRALNRPHVRPMDFTGRPIKAWSSSSPAACTVQR
jgi:hypothetical protein